MTFKHLSNYHESLLALIDPNAWQGTMLEVFSRPAWSRLVLTLVHSLWQGVAAAMLLVLALRLFSGRRSQLRYVLCCVSLFAVPAGAILTWSWLSHSDFRVAQSTIPAQLPQRELPARDSTSTTSDQLATSDQPTGTLSNEGPGFEPVLQSTIDGIPVAANNAESTTSVLDVMIASNLSPLAAVLWVVGVIAMLVRLISQIVAGRQLCRKMLPAEFSHDC